MKITRIETLRPKAHPNQIWVRVETNEGLIGLGETWFGAEAVEADIHGRIAPLLLGREAEPVPLWSATRPYVGFAGTGAEMRARSALDVALWDLKGQAEGKPIHDLLGGAVRESIRVYNTCAGPDYVSQTAEVRPDNFGLSGDGLAGRRFEDLDAFMNRPAELAAELLEMGISAMKIWPFDFAEGARDGRDISTEDLKRALEPFEQIRKTHGSKMRLKAELHGLWDLSAARKIAEALAPLAIDWIEDPVPMDRIDMIADLVAATDIRVAGGETLGGLGAFRDLIGRGGLAVPIMDVTWGGGITTAREVAALAQEAGRPIAFHDCSGPVTLAASVHLALACPNVEEQEITRGFYYGWYHALVDRPPPLEGGMIRAPDGPGLGLGIRPELLAGDELRRRRSEG
ncbi:MAG: mandelate racemase/muconate lactonizing enzyme family protein [Kiloniellales bacterium]|nr:mandelate racemase/muconate lactonizing enzyme family protein [Kiloniellales bacterium]